MKYSTTRKILLFAALAGFVNSSKTGAATANFTDGESTTQMDGYTGMAGNGWAGAWVATKSGSASFSNSVTNVTPVSSGGNRLSINLNSGSENSAYSGAVGRKFDTSVISQTAPHTVSFKVRWDSAYNTADSIKIMGDVGTGYIWDTGPNNTWLISTYYNGGNPIWRLYDGNGDGSSTAINTTMGMSPGTVYTMTVRVDPHSKSWTVEINNGATTYQSGTLGFRNPAATGAGNSFYFGGTVRGPNRTLNYSVDSVKVESGSGMPDEIAAKLESGSLDITQPNRNAWQTLTFSQTYANPVVVFGPPSANESEPVTVRVRNVTSTGCQVQLQEWEYQDGIHPLETVSYMVMEEGSYEIGGLLWTAGRKSGVTHTASQQTFPNEFPSPPIVLAQVTSSNEGSTVCKRVTGISTTKFDVKVAEQEAANGVHAGETIHYVAIEKGSGRLGANGLVFEVLSASDIQDESRHQEFSRKVAAPFLFADLQTQTDTDPAALRHASLYESSVDLQAQEESSASQDTSHSGEGVGILVLASQSDQDEDGMPDVWEAQHGLNPANAADAGLDPDGDSQTNVEEFRWGTNPGSADSAGTITITAEAPAAYELEHTRARLKISRSGGIVPAKVYFSLSAGTATRPGFTGADYRTEMDSGLSINGYISLPFNSNSAYIYIDPTPDTLNEYPETVTVTLTAKPEYVIGVSNLAVATVYDATDIPANNQIFVANLTPAAGVSSTASGLATLVLNGPKNRASVTVGFSGLSSAQTNAYIRYGVPGGVGPELRPNLGTGQLSNVTWNILPVGVYAGQQIIDALYQIAGEYLYINLGTTNYPAGEIAGTWTFSAGTGPWVPPSPPPPITSLTGPDLKRDVARFLTQTTFGPTQAEIDALTANVAASPNNGDRIKAFEAWIDQQLAYDQSSFETLVRYSNIREYALRGIDVYTSGPASTQNLRYGWWTLSFGARDQLRQRVAFALSEIMVISTNDRTVRAYNMATANYYDMLGSYATGNFRGLLESVSKHPMMGAYLSHLQNRKMIVDPSGKILVAPDENYAREIMQLFSIGLVEMNPDGSLKVVNGEPVPTYDNDDIQNLARVFTGWSYSKNVGTKAAGYPLLDNTRFDLPISATAGYGFFQYNWLYPMTNFADYHDTGAKILLGSYIPAGLDGQTDMTAALNILFQHPNVGPFIACRLIQRLVTSNPSPGYVYRVANAFENNGSGVRGDIKALIKAILLDHEARTLSVAASNTYGKQKEPMMSYIQLMRSLGTKSLLPISELSPHGYPGTQLDNFPAGSTFFRLRDTDRPPGLAQTPMKSPTVFNWFHPGYSPGGAISALGLVAPEMELNSDTNVIMCVNYHRDFLYAGVSGEALDNYPNPTADDMHPDFTPFVTIYDNERAAGKTVTQAATTVLDQMDLLLMGGNFKARYGGATSPTPRSIILDTVSGMSFTGSTQTLDRIKELFHLVTSSPEYLHQK